MNELCKGSESVCKRRYINGVPVLEACEALERFRKFRDEFEELRKLAGLPPTPEPTKEQEEYWEKVKSTCNPEGKHRARAAYVMRGWDGKDEADDDGGKWAIWLRNQIELRIEELEAARSDDVDDDSDDDSVSIVTVEEKMLFISNTYYELIGYLESREPLKTVLARYFAVEEHEEKLLPQDELPPKTSIPMPVG